LGLIRKRGSIELRKGLSRVGKSRRLRGRHPDEVCKPCAADDRLVEWAFK
jgi:hypothetical protein